MKNYFYLLLLILATGCEVFQVPVKGEQGPQGIQGAQGIPGPKGDKGDKGDPGDGSITIINASPTIMEGLEQEGIDNIKYLQGIIDGSPDRASLYLPSGTYSFSGTLRITNKTLYLYGTRNTNLVFPRDSNGIVIHNSEALLSGINFSQHGENGMLGTKKGHAIVVAGLCDLKYINIKNFGGDGVHTIADIGDLKTNASFNLYESVYVHEIGGSAFYFHGGDASQTLVLRCGSWDVSGYAFWDDSFLGNQFVGCMAHNSAKGHYRADNGNNRTTFVGCYAEQDSPNSIFGGVTRVIGGIHGIEGKGYVLTTPWAKVYTQ